jgi:phosphate transport system permease protein
MKSPEKYRIFIDRICSAIVCLLSLIVMISFFMIIWKLSVKGIKYCEPVLFQHPVTFEAFLEDTGNEKLLFGMINSICGIFYILFLALILSVPLGILAAIYIFDNRPHQFSSIVHYANSNLLGMPSVIAGMIVFFWLVKPLHHYSALAGAIALIVIMTPVIVHYTLRMLKTVPAGIKESGLALGISYADVTLHIVLPSIGKGLTAGILTAVSRALGKAAPLIMTAYGTSSLNWNIHRPTATLSVWIWNLFKDPQMIYLLWPAALFLFLTVFSLNGIAKYITRFQRNTKIKLMNR